MSSLSLNSGSNRLYKRETGTETSSDIYDEVDSITCFFNHQFAHRNSVCLFSPQLAIYRMMYLNLSEGITVIRQRWSPLSSTAGSYPDPPQSSLSQPPPPSYDFHRAPFVDFPIIQSHVHPFCIILKAGQKLHHKPYFRPPSHIDQSDF